MSAAMASPDIDSILYVWCANGQIIVGDITQSVPKPKICVDMILFVVYNNRVIFSHHSVSVQNN